MLLSGIHLYCSCSDSMRELVQWPHGRKKSSLEVELMFVQQHTQSKHTIQNQPLSSCTAYDSPLFPVVLWLQCSIGFYTRLLPLLHWCVHFSCPKRCRSLIFLLLCPQCTQCIFDKMNIAGHTCSLLHHGVSNMNWHQPSSQMLLLLSVPNPIEKHEITLQPNTEWPLIFSH